MTTTIAPTFEPLIVRLTDQTTYFHSDCAECAKDCEGNHAVTLPKGSRVLAHRATTINGYVAVDGIARPTIHGGGVHTQVRDCGTGIVFSAVVDAFVA